MIPCSMLELFDSNASKTFTDRKPDNNISPSGNFFTVQPMSKFALVGDNVTLSCELSVPACRDPQNPEHLLYWQYRQPSGSILISKCHSSSISVSPNKDRYAVTSAGLGWFLHVQNVQKSDAGRYWCRVFSYPDNGRSDSRAATLTVYRPVHTVVQPSRVGLEEGSAASFYCQAHREHGDSLTYAWYINGTPSEEFGTLRKYRLSSNGQNLTISRLSTELNNTEIACRLFSGSFSLTRQMQTAWLMVYPNEEAPASTQLTVVLTETDPDATSRPPTHPRGNP